MDSKSLVPIQSPRQLSIFEQQFDARIRRVEIDGVMRFSILDIFEHYGSEGSAKSPSTYWKNIQNKLAKQGAEQVLKDVLQHRFVDSAGKTNRATPVVSFKMLLRIAQASEIKEWEALRSWMADVAHERIEEAINPTLGLDRAHKRFVAAQVARGATVDQAQAQIAERIEVRDGFKLLMAEVHRVVDDKPRYWEVVDTEYIELLGQTTKGLRALLNTDSIRDALPNMQRQYIKTAEVGLTELLKHKDRMAMQQVIEAAKLICHPLGQCLIDICDMLKIDRVTGESLIASGKGGVA